VTVYEHRAIMKSFTAADWPPNYCQKLSSRRGLPRRPSRLGQRSLRGVAPVAGPFYKSEQPARRSAARRVKPACSLGNESLGRLAIGFKSHAAML
jgi:hypothetical protein